MSADVERDRWELRSGEGVGPLQFGMSPPEAADALLVSGPLARVGGPYEQEDLPDGVKAFYDAGKLACVALDAVTGPQVFLADFLLAGSDPVQGHQFLLDHAAEHGSWILWRAGPARFCCAPARSPRAPTSPANVESRPEMTKI